MADGTGRLLSVIAGVVLIAFGCARTHRSVSSEGTDSISTAVNSLLQTSSNESTYRYAFSGQILDEKTREPIPKFSIELVGDDPAISNVLNHLGDAHGLFHISRMPATESSQFSTSPMIISAVGYEPYVQLVDLGSDCLSPGCPGVQPTPFYLKPLPGTSGPNKPPSTKRIQEIINEKGVSGLFRDLINLGKWDSKTRADLSQARNAEVISNVVVFLNTPTDKEVLKDVSAIFRDGDAKRLAKLPANWTGRAQEVVEIALEHREIANSLVSVGELLPYLSGLAPKLSTSEGGPLAGLVQRFLAEKNTEAQLAAMVVSPKPESRPELAMVSLMPLLQGWISKGDSSTAYESFLSRALRENAAMEWLANDSFLSASDDVSNFVGYLQPLAQAFVGKQGAFLMKEFNRLAAGDGLKNLRAFDGSKKEFQELAPYVLPIVWGLNGRDGKRLTQALYPILQRQDPALVIKNIIVRMDTMDPAKRSRVIATLFPAAGDWAQFAVPAKQVFAVQVLSGLYFGDLKEVRITQDLRGGRAVVLSAQARDIFKLTMLPNVEKVFILKDK